MKYNKKFKKMEDQKFKKEETVDSMECLRE